MTFPTISVDEMRAGQMLTGFTVASWLLAGVVPRYGHIIRVCVLAFYLTGIAAFVIWFLIR